MPIREITRRMRLSRNTVRKYLANGVVEPRSPNRKSPSKLDDYELTLSSWVLLDSVGQSWRLFDILDLLAHLLDQDFQFNRCLRHRDIGRFGSQRVGFAI